MKALATVLLICALHLPALAGESATNSLWFPVGEKLTYKLKWGFITVGRGEVSSEWIEYDGKRMIALRAKARTSAIVARVYPVDDDIESIVDPKTFLPVKYTQRLREGKHVRNESTIFDHDAKLATWTSKLDMSSKVIPIEKGTRDVLSLLYFMRRTGIKPGEAKSFRVLVDDKIFDLKLKGIEYDHVRVRKKGKLRCMRIQPDAKFGGIFSRKGEVRMWFTDDKRRICTAVRGKVPMVSLKAQLLSVDGPESETWPDAELKKKKKKKRE